MAALRRALTAWDRLAMVRFGVLGVAILAAGCGPESEEHALPVSPPRAAVAGSFAPALPTSPLMPAAGSGALPQAAAGSMAVGQPSAPDVAPALGFCDVEPVFRARCQSCHASQPQFGAPMPLVTYDDLQAASKTMPAQKVYQRVGARIHDKLAPMPPASSAALEPDAIAKIDGWVAAGAPQGPGAACPGAPPPSTGPSAPANATGRAITDDDAPWPDDCGEHYMLLASDPAGGKYRVQPGRQFYANVTIPAPWGNKQVQALRFKAVLDNTKILHHYILYAGDQSFIDGWAPGQHGITMPPGVGLQLPAGPYRLELHYNNATGTQTELDASGVEVCIAKSPRPNVAAVHELGSMAISVPAHGMQVLNSTCRPAVRNGPVHLLEMNPHMHKSGVHAKAVLKRANGQEVMIHDAPFSFDDQRKYILPEDGSAPDLMVNAGDTITTTCTFMNTGDRPQRFGQYTEDEMCFFYVIAWPMNQLVNGSRGPEGDPNACL
jgi:hypothetical protein